MSGKKDVLADVRKRAKQQGLEDSSLLTVRQVVELTGVADRTIRRYIADGLIVPQHLAGTRGKEYRLVLGDIVTFLENRASSFVRVQGTPVDAINAELQKMAQLLEERERAHSEERAADRQLLEKMARHIEQLEGEQRDTRGQLAQFQEQVLKALPERSSVKKRGFWARFTERT